MQKISPKPKNISCIVNLNNQFSWFTDKDLLFLLMNNVFVKVMRYAAVKLKFQGFWQMTTFVCGVKTIAQAIDKEW